MRLIGHSQLSRILQACGSALLGVSILCAETAALVARQPSPIAKTKSHYKPASQTDNHTTKTENPTFLERITNRSDFDLLARVYYRDRFGALPHVMFVIDRRSQDRVYYINSRAYKFHKDFLNATYLSLERGRALYEQNYLKTNRRFILGTIAYQTTADRFSFEFWEGDQITSELLRETITALKPNFYGPLYFKPNSIAQELAVTQLNKAGTELPVFSEREFSSGPSYQALNLAAGIGQLRILDRLEPDTVLDRNQIVIFKQAPIHLTPLSGIITTEAASPLSHVNMLARSWGIPNASIRNADKLFKQLEGKYVRLEVRDNDYSLSPADTRDVEERNREWVKRADLVTPKADLEYNALTDLKQQRAKDAIRFGAKSANLGEIIHAKETQLIVPQGFAIPFHFYQSFIRLNNLEERIATAVEEDRFVHDPRYRKTRLEEIRHWIVNGRHDRSFTEAVLAKVHREYSGMGLFVRSSTNAEDLPDFSGAGLYTTVPNVRGDEQLLEAIKTVWASIWNYEAYEARESFGMNHFGVYPAVLIQEGIDADSAGVAITTDPFDRANRGAVFINAKRGLGIKVVEGRRVAEQVIYNPISRSINVLTRSDDDSMLVFDDNGGVKEVAIDKNRRVLTDPLIRELARAALQIKRIFRGRDQDIEWVFRRGRLFIVQSRPFIEQ
jgi:rifampicin phosphotransferase